MSISAWTEQDIYLVAERAHSLHQQGRYEEAAIIFKGLVAVDPGNHYCRKALAAAYMACGRAELALEQIDKVLALYPHDMDALARHCEAHLELDRLDEARRDWAILKRASQDPQVRRLGLCVQAALMDRA